MCFDHEIVSVSFIKKNKSSTTYWLESMWYSIKQSQNLCREDRFSLLFWTTLDIVWHPEAQDLKLAASRLCFFADDVNLLASLSDDLQLALGWFSGECKAVEFASPSLRTWFSARKVQHAHSGCGSGGKSTEILAPVYMTFPLERIDLHGITHTSTAPCAASL